MKFLNGVNAMKYNFAKVTISFIKLEKVIDNCTKLCFI